MKNTFWKHTPVIFLALPTISVISTLFIIFGSIFLSSLWPMLALGIILLISFILIILFDKRLMSKVTFNNNGILITYFKKIIIFTNWSDVIEIKETPYSRSSSYLSFLSKNNQIDIDPSKKIYDTIMAICPYQHLKSQLNSIDRFKGFHRKKS